MQKLGEKLTQEETEVQYIIFLGMSQTNCDTNARSGWGHGQEKKIAIYIFNNYS